MHITTIARVESSEWGKKADKHAAVNGKEKVKNTLGASGKGDGGRFAGE